MCATGKLFRTRVDKAADNLRGLHKNGKCVNKKTAFLLIALESANWENRDFRKAGFTEDFANIIRTVFDEIKPYWSSLDEWSSTKQGIPSFALACYPRSSSIGKAAARIRNRMVSSRLSNREPCYMAISLSEEDAFRKILLARNNEIIVDSSLEKHVPPIPGRVIDDIGDFVESVADEIPFI